MEKCFVDSYKSANKWRKLESADRVSSVGHAFGAFESFEFSQDPYERVTTSIRIT